MSEILKNIETCRGEDVLAEVSGLPQDPHFGSLVNEALDPLKQQAAAQEGWDGYSEVIEQHKPYTFASFIVQMKSNLLLLLRALWQFPFGSGTLRSLSDDASLRSLSDMWSHYIDRLHGSETYGIPSRLSSLTDLPSAPLLVADRKISGVPDAVDGISLVQLIGGAYNDVEELTDDNEWTFGSYTKVNTIASLFPNAAKITMNGIISSISGRLLTSAVVNELNLRGVQATYLRVRDEGMFLFNGTQDEVTVRFGWIDQTRTSNDDVWIFGGNMTKVHFLIPKFVTDWHTRLVNNGLVEEFDMSETTEFYNNYGGMVYSAVEASCNALKTFKFGTLTRYSPLSFNSYYNCPNLIRLEVGQWTSCSLDFSSWNPSAETIADADFLPNFRTYIALRLTDNGSGKTLTLSQAVYDAIKDESHLFVFDEGTMTIYAYLTNIKHWTVTK